VVGVATALADGSAPVLCGALPARGGCYDARAAPGSGVCREARDGACVMYKEEAKIMHAGAGERIDKQGEPEMQREVKAAQVTCTEGTNTGQCKTGKCISIGEDRVCTDCGKAGEVPINGKCVVSSDSSVTAAGCTKSSGDLDDQSTTCGKCTQTGYFLHKGGCYLQTATPGSTICKTAGSTAGICQECQAGYFKNPANADTSDSCIPCSDTTGVTIGSSDSDAKTYKGVNGCATCDAPESLQTSGTAVATCTECSTNLYLKTDSGTTSCVASDACTGGFFPMTDNTKKLCTKCDVIDKGGVADCTTCAPKEGDLTKAKCTACGNSKVPNADGSACVDAPAPSACPIEGCKTCSADKTACEECNTDKYLTPTGQCVDSCDKLGSYYADSQRVCQPCDPSCASCVGANANQCSACPAGKALKYTDESSPTDGSCVDECKANTGGCADCGATIGGSKYCSRCSDTNQAPLNGNCAANTMRTQFCTTVKDGACTQCANNYFLLDGGCYETSRQPGKSVCTTDSNGKYQTCANTLSPSNGVCPVCAEGCAKCATNANTCTMIYSTHRLLPVLCCWAPRLRGGPKSHE
ncbi:Variant-specific surface protein, partial [Giardia duodenalis]